MLRVALTGGVGSGKSTVADILRRLGAHVSQSDEIAREFMQPGQTVFRSIVDRFGRQVLSAAGQLDRAALADLAFTQGRLEELNAIVHPAVIATQTLWMEAVLAKEPRAIAVVESALVFETKYTAAASGDGGSAVPWRSRFDRIAVVTAPKPLRMDRYVRRVSQAGAQQDEHRAQLDFVRRAAAQSTLR